MKSLLVASLLSLSSPAPVDSQCLKVCEISDFGIDQIKLFEGYSPFIYKDIAGLPTIGHGHLILKGETFRTPLLPLDADALMRKDLVTTIKGVNRRVNVQLWQPQFDSLCSWTYNFGEGNLSSSTMLKRVNAKRHKEVPAEILKWNKATDPKTKKKVVSRGLTIRRETEANMYRQGELLEP